MRNADGAGIVVSGAMVCPLSTLEMRKLRSGFASYPPVCMRYLFDLPLCPRLLVCDPFQYVTGRPDDVCLRFLHGMQLRAVSVIPAFSIGFELVPG